MYGSCFAEWEDDTVIGRSRAPDASVDRMSHAAGVGVIDAEVALTGDVETSGALDVRGRITGRIVARVVTVFDGALVEGEIVAERVEIHGRARGGLSARSLRLHAGSDVRADVWAADFRHEDGADFVGRIFRHRPQGDWPALRDALLARLDIDHARSSVAASTGPRFDARLAAQFDAVAAERPESPAASTAAHSERRETVDRTARRAG